MSKLPVSASSHSKPNTTSSAWTRLVQTTKTASKISRHGDARPPSLRRQPSQTSAASLSASPRPMKRRRIAGPKSQSAPKSAKKLTSLAAVSRHENELAENSTGASATTTVVHTKQSIRVGSEHVETCASSKEEPHSSDRECDPTQPSKPESALMGVPFPSPTHSDLRAFWGPAKESRRLRHSETSQESDELEDEGAVLHKEMNESVQRDITDATSKVVTKSNLMASMDDISATNATVNRSSEASSFLRRSSRTRQRYKLELETGRLDNENKQKCQTVATDQKFQNAVDFHTKGVHTVRDLPGAPPPAASTPGLHDNTSKASLNSLSEAHQLATPTSPGSSVSDPGDKENANSRRKTKRRLTLHDTQIHQHKNKKRKAAPKQTVQTTLALAIGGNAGMRECKVCDTVYNPLHPEDVKVHAKRHAGVVRKERKHVEV